MVTFLLWTAYVAAGMAFATWAVRWIAKDSSCIEDFLVGLIWLMVAPVWPVYLAIILAVLVFYYPLCLIGRVVRRGL